jgi:hypothetical protein
MAATVVIAKNQTVSAIPLKQLSVPNGSLPATPTTVTLTTWNTLAEIQADDELLVHVTSGDVVLNVDGVDLSIAEGVDFMGQAQRNPRGTAAGDLSGDYPGPTVTDFTLPGQAQGDTLYFNGSNWIVLPAGTNGQVLETTGPASNPQWVDPSASGGNVTVNNIGGATYTTLQDMMNLLWSAGCLTGGTVTDAGGGNVDVAGGTGLIRDTDSRIASLFFFDFPASAGIAIPVDSTRYLGVEYNAGSPQVVVKTTDTWNYNTEFPIAEVFNEGGILHIHNDCWVMGDDLQRIAERFSQTAPFVRDEDLGGLTLGESADGNRFVTVSGGAIWHELLRYPVVAVDTDPGGAADTMDRYYRDGSGGFTLETVVTWNNTQYDDGTGTLASIPANRYANQWFYLDLNGDLLSQYGRATYSNVNDARQEAPPATGPDRITESSIIIGRIIFRNGDTVATRVDSAFTQQFGTSATTSHSDLAGLAWTSAGHTSTAGVLASFDGTGAAAEVAGTTHGDILYFNGTVWTRLAPGTAGQVLQTQGAGSPPQWAAAGAGGDHAGLTNLAWTASAHTGTINTFAAFNGAGAAVHLTTSAGGDTSGTWPTLQVNDLTIASEEQGSILYFNGSNWVELPPGTSGQVLQTNGTAANPSWVTPTGGTTDHSALTNLSWTASGHTGTAGSLATFDGATAAALLTGVAQGDVIYFNGTVWVRLAPGTSGQFLQTQGAGANPQWATPAGSGDVSGPGSSTDNALVRWDLTTGTLIQDSNVILSDTGDMTFAGGTTLSVDNIAESTTNNGVVINGTRHYPDSAADPAVGPAAVEGDRYYNTTLEMEMRYDGLRSKWLSVNEVWLHFGRAGNTATNSFFDSPGGIEFTASRGLPAPFNGTVVAMAYTRDDTDDATVEVTRNGTLITGAVLQTNGVSVGTDSTLNADFTSGGTDILGVRNQGPNTMSNVTGWVRIKWRA